MQDPLNNHEIRRLLRSLPEEAIKVLWREYHASLLRIAFDLTRDEEAAKDIVQDTFALLWTNATKLSRDHQRSIQHYLVKVVRNKSRSYYKEQIALTKRKIRLTEQLNSSELPVEARIIQMEAAQILLEVIARFPLRERQCLRMRLDAGLKNDEMSIRLGVGVKAVERSLTSARRRLRIALGRFGKKS